jgi:hypothetical protein
MTPLQKRSKDFIMVTTYKNNGASEGPPRLTYVDEVRQLRVFKVDKRLRKDKIPANQKIN